MALGVAGIATGCTQVPAYNLHMRALTKLPYSGRTKCICYTAQPISLCIWNVALADSAPVQPLPADRVASFGHKMRN